MENEPPCGLPQRETRKRQQRGAVEDTTQDEVDKDGVQPEGAVVDLIDPLVRASTNSGNTEAVTPSQLNLKDEDTERRKPCGDDELPEYRSCAVGSFQFEYLDHTADVQIHSWGRDVSEAFAQAALGMFNYMTPLDGIRPKASECTIEAEGHDMMSLLFAFLDEFLFVFHTEFLVCNEVEVLEFDRENWKIRASGSGERFDRERHESGTEVKAITYSAMQIHESEGDAEVFVIVDI
ncbi:hypothetical protein BSKO_06622 [Bryopsis sp. KO-2023]|nr:hypothetical protein BSKO_06622 [Bryopsis sp. KO-2023]